MFRRPPRSTRTDTLCPYTPPFRSASATRKGEPRDVDVDIEPPRRIGERGVAEAVEGGALGDQRRERGANLVKRSEEHTSELQSLMRISYAVFCLKKKKITRR